ncbi:MAG: ATP-dependent DNA helicase RecG, partial [Helicobacter sp.]|nr:ATP-dependent DNA helicase RecG [Helicobacter sp.]
MEIPESIKKLGIHTFFEFVLSFTPKSYTNSHLSQTLEVNAQAVLKVEVLRYFSYKVAKVLCYTPLFDREIELVIFNPKPYHKNIFAVGEILVVSGKIQKNGEYYTLIQPKILKSLEGIFPNFGKKGAKESLLRDYSKNISLQSLQSFYPKIPLKYLKALLIIYQPNFDFFTSFQKQGSFFGDFLDALKFVEIYEYMRKLRIKKREFQSLKPLEGEIESWID